MRSRELDDHNLGCRGTMPGIAMRPYFMRVCGLVVILLVVVALSGCHRVLCSDSPGPAMVSPDARYVASVIQSDCGAKEHATVIEVRRNRALMQDKHSVFVMEGFQKVSVAWSGKHEMSITAPTCDAEKTRLSNWNEVTVHCEVTTLAGANAGR